MGICVCCVYSVYNIVNCLIVQLQLCAIHEPTLHQTKTNSVPISGGLGWWVGHYKKHIDFLDNLYEFMTFPRLFSIFKPLKFPPGTPFAHGAVGMEVNLFRFKPFPVSITYLTE